MRSRLLSFLLLLLCVPACLAEAVHNFPPHKVVGNLYYVGEAHDAAFLIVTPKGNILLNPGEDDLLPMIKENIATLGFQYKDTKVVLISQAHWDHNGAVATVLRETGAQYMVMDGDVDVVESGGKTDFAYGDQPKTYIPIAKIDRVLHDGSQITLGGSTIVARKTPGHTKGCATYTMKIADGGHTYNVVIVGGWAPNNEPGFVLVNNPKYPEIAEDFRKAFQVYKSLPVDIWVGAHGDYYGLTAKYPRMKTEGVKAWVDPMGYKKAVADKEASFEALLEKQKKAAH